MRLLILTQKVDSNDPVLGFFHRWIEEFAKHCETVVVVCLQEGARSLPANVRVCSLGKEKGVSRIKHLARFYASIWQERKHYDAVFVHMNPEYVLMGGLLWRLWKKPVALWYTHRQVHGKLRAAVALSSVVFSASELSFNVKTNKLRVMRHGIDTRMFSCEQVALDNPLTIISVGRITPIKNPDVLIEAARVLRERLRVPFRVVFYGSPSHARDEAYKAELDVLIKRYALEDVVHFAGAVPNGDMPKHYCASDVVVNLTPTGGIDKTVLEAMASGKLVCVSNTAFAEHFGQYHERLIFREGDAADLADTLHALIASDDKEAVRAYLKARARSHFDVRVLVPSLVDEMKTLCAR